MQDTDRTAYLQEMAYLYAAIGRVDGSTCEPWVNVPEGFWCVQELDYRIIKRLCFLLGCKVEELKSEK